MSETIVYISCPPREAAALVDELMDLLTAAGVRARVLKYGVTTKTLNGFLLLACTGRFPQDVLAHIHKDAEIADYVVCSDYEPGVSAAGTETHS